MKPASMTAAQIAALLAEMEIDSDPAYDMRKREQLAWAFAHRLYGDEPSRRAFVRRVNPDGVSTSGTVLPARGRGAAMTAATDPQPIEDQGTVLEASERLVKAADKLDLALSAETCDECGIRARHHVNGLPYCRPCAWHANDGKQPADDTDNEPPGAGADYWGRPDPQTEPGAWRE